MILDLPTFREIYDAYRLMCRHRLDMLDAMALAASTPDGEKRLAYLREAQAYAADMLGRIDVAIVAETKSGAPN